MLLAIYLGGKLMAESNNTPSAHIEANNNTIINIGAEAMQMSPQIFEAIIRAAMTDKKELAKATTQVLRPTRNDPDAALVLDNEQVLSVPSEVIKEIPVEFMPGEDVKTERMAAAELFVRATNRDSNVSGWMARLPLRFDRKVKLVLGSEVDPEEIASLAQVTGDVEIHYRRTPNDNKYVPEKIVLLRVIQP
jgi:hypothetical protein